MKFRMYVFLLSLLLMLGAQVTVAKDDALLDALHAEAEDTSMEEDKTLEGSDIDPVIEMKEITDYDALEKKVAEQIKGLLKQPSNDSEKPDKKIADKLENIVSSALLQGNKMDDIRSAVSAAMMDIKKTSVKAGSASKAVIESAGKALKDIVAEKKVVVTEMTANPTQAKSVKTVTVREGESLYKIAQRVYGSGKRYLELYKANKDVLKNPNRVRVGQVLKVP